MSSDADTLFDVFQAEFVEKKYVAGLLLAMIDLVNHADQTHQYSNVEAFLAARQVSQLSLTVRDDAGKRVSLRSLYQRWQKYFRHEQGRGNYPSSPAHASQSWSTHTDWLDRILRLSLADRTALASRVETHVLSELPSGIAPSQRHGRSLDSFDPGPMNIVQLAQGVVEPGAATSTHDIIAAVARALPAFRPEDHGYASLEVLLALEATDIARVDERGGEALWARQVDDADDGLLLETQAPRRLLRMRFFNYRSLNDTELSFDRFTMLVGPNAAGKSNILDGIFRAARMSRFPGGMLFAGRNAPSRVRTYGADEPFELTVEQDRLPPWTYLEGEQAVVRSQSPVGPVAWLKLEPTRIARPSISDRVRPLVERDGAGVSAVLADLSLTVPERLDTLVSRVRRVIPAISGLRSPRAPMEDGTNEIGNQLQAKIGAHWVPADQLSDGTLLVIALHTAIVGGGVHLLLLDDLDRALHPGAQRVLLAQLMELVEADEQLQIVATTHSPIVLDVLKPEWVRLVQNDGEGTQVHRLTDHRDWERWKMMTPGEFWTYIGEDWSVGG